MTPEAVQKLLADQKTSGSGVNGQKAIGGTVRLPAGELVWNKSVYLGAGQKVVGEDSATRITFLGGPGSYAFVLRGGVSKPYCKNAGVFDMQIDCTDGGDAIGVEAGTIAQTSTFQNLSVHRGGIYLNGEHYQNTFEKVRFYEPARTALRIDGQCNVIRTVLVDGTVINRKVRGAIEIHGSANLEGFVWGQGKPFAGSYSAPMFYFGDWKQADGYVHPGNVAVAGLMYDEAGPGHVGPWGVVENSTFTLLGSGATASWPWHLNRGAIMRSVMPLNAGAVKRMDAASKLFVNGIEQAVAVEK